MSVDAKANGALLVTEDVVAGYVSEVDVLSGVSIQNQLCGRVVRCTIHDRRAIVEIDIGARLLAEVSLRTVADLEIQPGRTVWCLVKSNAIRYLDPPDSGPSSYFVGT